MYTYKGIVYISFKKNGQTILNITTHNGAEKYLREAFANMLTGYKITQYIPFQVYGKSKNGATSEVVEITSLNKQYIEVEGISDSVPCANLNAIIPLTSQFDVNSAIDSQTIYHLQNKSEQDLATFTFDDSNLSENDKNILQNLGAGVSLNIRWQMYLQG